MHALPFAHNTTNTKHTTAADFAQSTKKSRKGASSSHTGTAYAVSDILVSSMVDRSTNGNGSGAGGAGGGVGGASTKEGVSKKSRRQSVA